VRLVVIVVGEEPHRLPIFIDVGMLVGLDVQSISGNSFFRHPRISEPAPAKAGAGIHNVSEMDSRECKDTVVPPFEKGGARGDLL
jgi:hypothetical protein